jgi:hypothetical protein
MTNISFCITTGGDNDEMIQKVISWGHNKDIDWVSLIEQEFTHDFNGKDFIHNYEYDVLDC